MDLETSFRTLTNMFYVEFKLTEEGIKNYETVLDTFEVFIDYLI